VTGWGFTEIMETLPLSAGLQIIDADLCAKGIERVYQRANDKADFDSLQMMNERFAELGIKP
jgi:hypothetical protein